jgi:general secretion pathway protein A
MYEQFFGLTQNPFMLVPDPRFLYLTAQHREALTGLAYSVSRRKGFAVVTGDAGTGKTTLLRTLLQSLSGDVCQFSMLVNPTLTRSEFLETILLDFGIKNLAAGKARQLVQLREFLRQRYNSGLIAAILVDEAHQLSPELMEEIRLLTNFEESEGKFLQIVLAGQNELDDTLDAPELRQLKQRIACRLRAYPLSASQLLSYLRFRWTQAGGGAKLPFGDDAIDYLGLFSGGIPRVINAICDNALLIAFAEKSKEVRPEHIIEAAKDLALREAKCSMESPDLKSTQLDEISNPEDMKKYLRASCLPESNGRRAPSRIRIPRCLQIFRRAISQRSVILA